MDLVPTLHRAAVHFEKGDYDACIEDCDKAVERGRELRADYKLIARCAARQPGRCCLQATLSIHLQHNMADCYLTQKGGCGASCWIGM